MSLLNHFTGLENPQACDDESALVRENWAVLNARPDMPDRSQVLWLDLMTALGHKSMHGTRSRSPNSAQTQAFCWLGTADIDYLAVTSANFLTAHQLADLCAMTSALGICLWLIYDVEPSDERLDALVRVTAIKSDLNRFLEVRALSSIEKQISVPVTMDQVPETHFLEFLQVCAEMFEGEKLERIRTLFHRGRTTMLDEFSRLACQDENEIGLAVHRVSSLTNNIDESRCIIAGAMAAAFISGWYLQIDIDRWIQRGTMTELSIRLSDEDWAALSQLQHPCAVAACVLSVLGISSDAMPALTIDMVAKDASTVQYRNEFIPVPTKVRRLLISQMLYRNLVGSSESPYLVMGPKEADVTALWAGTMLRAATKETGVVLRGWIASRKSNKRQHWFARSGIIIKRLTP